MYVCTLKLRIQHLREFVVESSASMYETKKYHPSVALATFAISREESKVEQV
jgi:hypothetical protein